MDAENESAQVQPMITLLDPDQIEYRSRVKFRANSGSRELINRLLDSGQMQIIWEHVESGHRLTCWPLDEDFLILEITDVGNRWDITANLEQAHRFKAEAQARVLRTTSQYSEFVPLSQFRETGLRPARLQH